MSKKFENNLDFAAEFKELSVEELMDVNGGNFGTWYNNYFLPFVNTVGIAFNAATGN